MPLFIVAVGVGVVVGEVEENDSLLSTAFSASSSAFHKGGKLGFGAFFESFQTSRFFQPFKDLYTSENYRAEAGRGTVFYKQRLGAEPTFTRGPFLTP